MCFPEEGYPRISFFPACENHHYLQQLSLLRRLTDLLPSPVCWQKNHTFVEDKLTFDCKWLESMSVYWKSSLVEMSATSSMIREPKWLYWTVDGWQSLGTLYVEEVRERCVNAYEWRRFRRAVSSSVKRNLYSDRDVSEGRCVEYEGQITLKSDKKISIPGRDVEGGTPREGCPP